MPAATAGIFQHLCTLETAKAMETAASGGTSAIKSTPKLTMMVTEGRREFFDVIKTQTVKEPATDENPTPFYKGREILIYMLI